MGKITQPKEKRISDNEFKLRVLAMLTELILVRKQGNELLKNPLITADPNSVRLIKPEEVQYPEQDTEQVQENYYTVKQFADLNRNKLLTTDKKLSVAQTRSIGMEAIHWARCLNHDIPVDVHKKRPMAIHRESILRDLLRYHKYMK